MSEEITANSMFSKFLFVIGWVLNFSGWITEADLILSFILKITSLISFVIFLIINFPKIKEALKNERD